MLKSIDFIKRLEMDLNDNIETKNIIDFFIELRINQDIDIYIASEKIKSTSDLFLRNVLLTEFDNNKLHIEIIDDNKYIDEDYKYLFEGDKTSYGLRRSLSALLNIKNDKKNKKHSNLITFYSYKGGVGRTTSLALTATYLARKGNNVFVIDCD
ncbi:AAA family ATPase, partial [Klebsiella pneumoniae]